MPPPDSPLLARLFKRAPNGGAMGRYLPSVESPARTMSFKLSQLLTPPEVLDEQKGWKLVAASRAPFILTGATFLTPFVQTMAIAADERGDFFLPIEPTSVVAYCSTLSSLIVMCNSPMAGVLADSSPHRLTILRTCNFAGAVALMCYLFVFEWWMGALLLIVCALTLEFSFVFWDAYLPEIAEGKARVKLSADSVLYTNASQLFMLCLQIPVTLIPGLGTNSALRIMGAMAGGWWGVVSWRGTRKMGHRKGRERPPEAGVRQLKATVAKARRDVHISRFLLSFMFFQNGVFAIYYLFASYFVNQLEFSDTQLGLYVVLVQACGVPGAFLSSRISRLLGDKPALLLCYALWAVLCVLIYLLAKSPDDQMQMFGLAPLVGTCLGAGITLTRSFYSHLIPVGQEAEYAALYNFSGKCTSWSGTLFFALVNDATGSMRSGMLSLMTFFTLAFMILLTAPPPYDARKVHADDPEAPASDDGDDDDDVSNGELEVLESEAAVKAARAAEAAAVAAAAAAESAAAQAKAAKAAAAKAAVHTFHRTAVSSGDSTVASESPPPRESPPPVAPAQGSLESAADRIFASPPPAEPAARSDALPPI